MAEFRYGLAFLRMKNRPYAVTVVSWLMVAAGAFGLARGFIDAKSIWPAEHDLIWIIVIDLIGIACGWFLLKGHNWARWATLLWVGGHVVLVSLYMPRMILVHALIFAMISYLLAFREDVREYFVARRAAD